MRLSSLLVITFLCYLCISALCGTADSNDGAPNSAELSSERQADQVDVPQSDNEEFSKSQADELAKKHAEDAKKQADDLKFAEEKAKEAAEEAARRQAEELEKMHVERLRKAEERAKERAREDRAKQEEVPLQHSRAHRWQPVHDPPIIEAEKKVHLPTNPHEAASRALQATFPPEPFKKVRLRIPLQVISVHGCPHSTSPRRATSGCHLDGSTRITIRGRGFQSCLSTFKTSSAWLVEAVAVGNTTKPLAEHSASEERSTSENEAPSVPILRIPCQDLDYSSLLPDLVAYCTLPKIEGPLAEQLDVLFKNNSHTKFHFQLFSGDLTQSAVLHDAVTLSRRAVSAAGTNDESESMKSAPIDDVDAEDELIDETLQAAVATGNWKALGIGGLDKQFSELFRRALSTRSTQASQLATAIGIQHIKGVILHGPPGTGKTLAARMLAKLLHAKDITIVNGPEIMSKYVGDSEKNLRELFTPAITEFKKKKDRAGLYVVVFDEVDAILRPRGQGEESSAKALYDGVTTQLLSYMDGIHSAPNILVIGLTNRLDALDKALLRPGRFEVQIRMHLPDKSGREEILWVHTQKLREGGYLHPDVNLVQLAEDTTSFSGADIAGAVRSAISFALERLTKKSSSTTAPDQGAAAQCSGASKGSCPGSDPSTLSPLEKEKRLLAENDEVPAIESAIAPSFKVHSADFRKAIREILAARSSGSGLLSYMGRGVVPYSKSVNAILSNIQKMADALLKLTGASTSGSAGRSTSPRVARYAIMGPRGSGKSTIAALAARNARFASSFVISPEMLIGMSQSEKIRRINDIFDTATHTPSAVVLLDDCDSIIELVGGKGSLNIVVALRALIHRDLTKVASKEGSGDGTLIIITTSTSEEVFQHLGLYQFEGHAMLADLSRGAAATVLQSYRVFGHSNDEDTKQLSITAARNLPPRIPIKRLMFFIDQCRAASDVDLRSLKAPIGDLTEHPLFPSLWAEDGDEETNEFGSGDRKEGDEKFFDPFTSDKFTGAKESTETQTASASAGIVTVEQFHAVLAQYNSFYSSPNVDFVVQDLTPV